MHISCFVARVSVPERFDRITGPLWGLIFEIQIDL
jgi:hypothetical protein